MYFGPWGDPDAALTKYLREKDDLHAGRKPRPVSNGMTVTELANRFLTTKKHALDAGEIGVRTFTTSHEVCRRAVAGLGGDRVVADLDADDFEAFRANLATDLGPVALGSVVGRIKAVFKFAYDQGYIAQPVRYGQSFNRPAKAVLRREKARRGPRMLEAAEIRAILDAASPTLRAMTLLGINCGFGNGDCASLPQAAINLEAGWIDFPRPKTGIPRRCPLWPETVQALREAIAHRPKPASPDHAGLVFLKRGRPWITWSGKAHCDRISGEYGKLLGRLGTRREGVNFYSLRHAFGTVAGDSRDQVAVNAIMGHADQSMAGVYRERIDDSRLLAVAEHVRRWLFGETVQGDNQK